MASNKLRTKTIDLEKAAQILKGLSADFVLKHKNSIYHSNNGVKAFGVYYFYNTENVYKITKHNNHIATVSTPKHALAWCIADKYKLRDIALKILKLDKELDIKQSEVTYYRHTLYQNVPTERKLVIEDKMQESVIKIRRIKNELNKCLNSAKYYQLKGFDNETSRIRKTKSN